MRLWISWTHTRTALPPFEIKSKVYGKGKTQSYAAMDADGEDHAKSSVLAYYPDAEFKFCMQKPNNWKPSMDAFPVNTNKNRR